MCICSEKQYIVLLRFPIPLLFVSFFFISGSGSLLLVFLFFFFWLMPLNIAQYFQVTSQHLRINMLQQTLVRMCYFLTLLPIHSLLLNASESYREIPSILVFSYLDLCRWYWWGSCSQLATAESITLRQELLIYFFHFFGSNAKQLWISY